MGLGKNAMLIATEALWTTQIFSVSQGAIPFKPSHPPATGFVIRLKLPPKWPLLLLSQLRPRIKFMALRCREGTESTLEIERRPFVAQSKSANKSTSEE